MPRPVTFTCTQELAIPPEQMFAKVRDVSSWTTFDGYGLLPGIEHAEYEVETPQVAGSVIRLRNSDGSTHTETIVKWLPPERLVLRLGNFSRPLSLIATHFDETWTFYESGNGYSAERSFAMHPCCAAAKIALWPISLMMRRAVSIHLEKIA